CTVAESLTDSTAMPLWIRRGSPFGCTSATGAVQHPEIASAPASDREQIIARGRIGALIVTADRCVGSEPGSPAGACNVRQGSLQVSSFAAKATPKERAAPCSESALPADAAGGVACFHGERDRAV